MREIKFRQPIFSKGIFERWHYWGFVNDSFSGVATGTTTVGQAEEQSQQFTGLKDIENKEIYEGDLILAWGRNDGNPCKVIFSDGKFQGLYSIGKFGFPLDASEINISNIKVIGNIYENKELLEVK